MKDWKLIKCFNDYWISNDGDIFSYRKSKKGRYLKPYRRNAEGHLAVSLSNDSTLQSFYVHELVITHFIGPRPLGLMCGHKDNDKTNNSVSNLEWITYKSNTAESINQGTHISVLMSSTTAII